MDTTRSKLVSSLTFVGSPCDVRTFSFCCRLEVVDDGPWESVWSVESDNLVHGKEGERDLSHRGHTNGERRKELETSGAVKHRSAMAEVTQC